MVRSTGDKLSPLGYRIRKLSNGRGVHDARLPEWLNPELRGYFGMNPDDAEDSLRDKTIERLGQYISDLETRAAPSVRGELRRIAIEVSFNICRVAVLTEKDQDSLASRQRWLEENHDVSMSTSQRILDDVSEQIAKRLRVTSPSPKPEEIDPIQGSSEVEKPQYSIKRTLLYLPERWRRRLIEAVIAVVVGSLIAWLTPVPHYLYGLFSSDHPLTGKVLNRYPTITPRLLAVSKNVHVASDAIEGWALPHAPASLQPVDPERLPGVANSPVAGNDNTSDTAIDRFNAWILQQGGATVGVTHLRLVLSAGAQPIQVQNICARIIQRGPALSGALFFKTTAGDQPIVTTLDLDAAAPCAHFFQGKTKTIGAHQNQDFDINAVSHIGAVGWSLFAIATMNGATKTIQIDPGATLRTTAVLPDALKYSAYYEYQAAVSGGEFLPEGLDYSTGNAIVSALNGQS